jgi:hypothetical protein
VAVPPVTVKSASTNPVTTSPKAIVTWNGSLLVRLTGPVVAGNGPTVSTITMNVLLATLAFPAKSAALPAPMLTDT